MIMADLLRFLVWRVQYSWFEAAEIVGEEYAEQISKLSLQIYTVARDYAAERGIIIADTKFEFALDEFTSPPSVVLVDEVLTPDSSRFWDAKKYQVGRGQESLDKQYLRDYLTEHGLKGVEGVELPKEVVERTEKGYREAFERLTGNTQAWKILTRFGASDFWELEYGADMAPISETWHVIEYRRERLAENLYLAPNIKKKKTIKSNQIPQQETPKNDKHPPSPKKEKTHPLITTFKSHPPKIPPHHPPTLLEKKNKASPQKKKKKKRGARPPSTLSPPPTTPLSQLQKAARYEVGSCVIHS